MRESERARREESERDRLGNNGKHDRKTEVEREEVAVSSCTTVCFTHIAAGICSFQKRIPVHCMFWKPSRRKVKT